MQIDNQDATVGVVNGPLRITLYSPDGAAVEVDATAVDTMLRYGFSRFSADPDVALADYLALLPNLAHTWEDYLAATRARGFIDSAAQDVAHETVRLVTAAANRLHLSIHTRWTSPGEDAVDTPTQ
jgi:hypothetical protein